MVPRGFRERPQSCPHYAERCMSSGQRRISSVSDFPGTVSQNIYLYINIIYICVSQKIYVYIYTICISYKIEKFPVSQNMFLHIYIHIIYTYESQKIYIHTYVYLMK